jgi:DNA-binding LacI/PurR family transcriptional regulator
MRLNGARAALNEQQLDFATGDLLPDFSSEAAVEAYLLHPDRPRALLAMWHRTTLDLLRVATRLGLSDLDLVGWGVGRQADEIAAAARATRIGLAIMIWNVDEMAEVVASRLQLHRTDPKLRPIHLVIPSRLVRVENDAV